MYSAAHYKIDNPGGTIPIVPTDHGTRYGQVPQKHERPVLYEEFRGEEVHRPSHHLFNTG